MCGEIGAIRASRCAISPPDRPAKTQPSPPCAFRDTAAPPAGLARTPNHTQGHG
jgi:hypothetical protein